MKVVVLEAGHWHFPLYQKALLAGGVDVVAISDHDAQVRERIGAAFNCRAFERYEDLIAQTDFDFAFVFGKHTEMGQIAGAVLNAGKAASIEKPLSLDPAIRKHLASLAHEKNLFVSFPLVYRMTKLPSLLSTFADSHAISHLSVRCFAGPPSRYLANGSPWMTDPAISGGGCTRNLAPHYVDLFLSLNDTPITSVSAHMNSAAYGAAVEDYSSLVLRAQNGAIATIETGYNFPVHYGPVRDFSLIVSTPTAFFRASESHAEILDRMGTVIESHYWDINSDIAFAPYTLDALNRFKDGQQPLVGFNDFNPVMAIIDAAYDSAHRSQPVFLAPDESTRLARAG
jgi:predicted dehydrogenase